MNIYCYVGWQEIRLARTNPRKLVAALLLFALATQLHATDQKSGDKKAEPNGKLIGGGIQRIGGDVKPPVPLQPTQPPKYTEEAQKAKFNGTAVLFVVIDVDGIPKQIKVVRSVGHGLDEKAVEAVRQWRFSPATRKGRPVPVAINVEVRFKLY